MSSQIILMKLIEKIFLTISSKPWTIKGMNIDLYNNITSCIF